MRLEKDYGQLIKEHRRALHRMPEAGFEEHDTSRYIERRLKALEPDRLEPVAKTGWIALFKGTGGGRTLAFRADMDGLPVEEDPGHEIRSEKPGMMHACGHDGHMAILLGLAAYAAENRGKIADDLLLVFQPAEEGPGGAKIIAEDPLFEALSIEAVYGLHLFPQLDQGTVGLAAGPVMAQSGEIDVLIEGKSAHGAQPQEGVDALVAAAAFVGESQKIVSRFLKPLEPAVVTFGRIEGGEARNIIADRIILEGTVRTFSEAVYKRVKERMDGLARGLEAAYGCRIGLVWRDMYPPVLNDPGLAEAFKAAYGGPIEAMEPQMLAEDFSYYQKKVPGLFLFLGVGNREKGFVSPLHSSRFNFDEAVLVKGLEAFVSVIR